MARPSQVRPAQFVSVLWRTSVFVCVLQFAVVMVPQVPCGAQTNWNHKLVQGLYRAVGEKLQLQLQHCCTVPCTSPLSRLSPPCGWFARVAVPQ